MKELAKFRGWNKKHSEWRYGYYFVNRGLHFIVEDKIETDPFQTIEDFCVEPESIGQFIGITDKNNKEIYKGDIVEYYTLGSYCINPDCDLAIQGYGTKLYKRISEVGFYDGIFGVKEEGDISVTPLTHCILTEEELEDLLQMKETDSYFDTNGYSIDNSIVGIGVVGNTYENPEL